MKIRLKPSSLAQILDCSTKKPTVLIATPNYEERSVWFPQKYFEGCISQAIDPSSVFTQFLWPQGQVTRVELLEQLKGIHFAKLAELRGRFSNEERTPVSYPDDFNPREVVGIVVRSSEAFSGEEHNIVVDISCMPKRVLFSVCEGVESIIRSAEIADCPTVFFVYTAPRRYGALRYAQNVGEVNGLFSGCSIRDAREEDVSAIILPGLQGYESKLLYDEIRSRVSSSVAALIAVSSRDYQTSLAVMRANQFLMERRDITVRYYFSLMDGVRKLERHIQGEAARPIREGSRMILAAPFGHKPFLAASFFILRNLASEQRIHPEIAYVSGFQYLSLYSLGVSHVGGFQLLLEE